MNRTRILRVATLAFLGFSFTYPFNRAEAVLVTIDADSFSSGTDISSAFSGVTLSEAGISSGSVYALSNSFNTTSPNVFAREFSSSLFANWILGQRYLRVDFAQPTDFVSIDGISDFSNTQFELRAYNSSNTLISSDTTANLASGNNETMSITRGSPDIAYVYAGGLTVSGNLDRLVYNSAAAAIPQLTTTPASSGTLSFGNVRIGSSADLSIQASNSGDSGSTLTGTFPSASGEFSPGSNLGFGPLLTTDSAVSRTYTYAPTDAGTDSQSVDVTSDGGSSTITLQGTGVGPSFASPSHGSSSLIDFGTLPVDSLFDIFVTLENTTSDSVPLVDIELVQLSLQSVEPVSLPFSIVGASNTVLDPGETFNLQVRFDTTGLAAGSSFSDSLIINTDLGAAFGDTNSGQQYSFNLFGSVAAVPEPSTFVIFSLSFLCLMKRKPRRVS